MNYIANDALKGQAEDHRNDDANGAEPITPSEPATGDGHSEAQEPSAAHGATDAGAPDSEEQAEEAEPPGKATRTPAEQADPGRGVAPEAAGPSESSPGGREPALKRGSPDRRPAGLANRPPSQADAAPARRAPSRSRIRSLDGLVTPEPAPCDIYEGETVAEYSVLGEEGGREWRLYTTFEPDFGDDLGAGAEGDGPGACEMVQSGRRLGYAFEGPDGESLFAWDLFEMELAADGWRSTGRELACPLFNEEAARDAPLVGLARTPEAARALGPIAPFPVVAPAAGERFWSAANARALANKRVVIFHQGEGVEAPVPAWAQAAGESLLGAARAVETVPINGAEGRAISRSQWSPRKLAERLREAGEKRRPVKAAAGPGGRRRSPGPALVTAWQLLGMDWGGAETGSGPVRYLLDGVLPLKGKLLVSAPAKAGKSFLAIQLGLALGSGRGEWLGWGLGEPARVIYIQCELSDEMVAARLRDMAAAPPEGIDMGRALENFHYLQVDAGSLNLNEPGGREAVASLLALHRPDAVIIDPMVFMFAGLAENDAPEVRDALLFLTGLAQRFSCAVALVHHTGRAGSGPRGSSVLDAWPDADLRMGQPGGDGTVKVEARLRCSPPRGPWTWNAPGEGAPWFSLLGDADNADGPAGRPRRATSKRLKAEAIASAIAEKETVKTSELVARLAEQEAFAGKSEDSIKASLREAVAGGAVEKVGHGQYRLPGADGIGEG